MKYYWAIIFPLLLLFSSNSSAQIEPGARQIALANSTVALSNDAFALFNNPAGIAQIGNREMGIFYSPAPFGLKQLSNAYAAYVEPFGFGNLSLGIKRYGFKLYNETAVNFSYSKKLFQKYFFGIDLIYSTLNIKNYGTSHAFYFRFGFLYRVMKNLTFGFAAENFRNVSYVKNYSSISRIIRAGLSYEIFPNVRLNFEANKNLRKPLSIRGGLEYLIFNFLFIRFGVRSEPDTYTAGVGIKYSIVQLDYAVFTHPFLGLTHQAGLLIRFGKPKL